MRRWLVEVLCGKRGEGGLLQLHTADYTVYNIQCMMYTTYSVIIALTSDQALHF